MKQYDIFKKLNLLKDQIMAEDSQSVNGLGYDGTVSFQKIEATLNDQDIDQNFQLDQNLENGQYFQKH